MNEAGRELQRLEDRLEDLVRQHVALHLRFICLEHKVQKVEQRIEAIMRGLNPDGTLL